ncbi:anthranilate synthase component 1 [Desulfosalsimonas propionicica]|uniref:Anthranilate synthase component 1 n=1 Tax=Desulfosalsimonas propionicica TaxID=332175 RepID=A0A7W0C815_9BACT|nr:anthranilate synthase component I family protein [Desulfosalsimonas propionicica]MBA2880886.1 anthranilate synthase component 1 [Desulfosalsimonas propionicica]
MRLRQFPDKDTFEQYFRRHNVVPVCREILADMETPVSVIKKLYSNQSPAFLLESVEGGERWGRYSFLSTSARTRVRVYAHSVETEKNGRTEKIAHNGDPLTVLRGIMQRYNPAVIPELPRFWGGLVGYFSYETVCFFEAIENRLPENQPMADFVIPDEMLIFDNIKNTLMMVAICFKNDNTDAQAAYQAAGQRIDALQKTILEKTARSTAGQNQAEPVALEPVHDASVYKKNVEIAKSRIKDGEIIQAVISQPFCANRPFDDATALYRAQRYINPSPYMFFMHLDDTVLVGSSPETMVRLENNIATLRPIAGTRPRGKTEQEDRALADEMLQDEKERAEHLMLVDLGRNDLGRVAETGTVQVTDLMVVERYSHVMHLVSNITCDLMGGVDAWDLLTASFPAGTLSGAPKVRAMEIISELESEPRGPYGGAVGYISFHGNMDLAITIRTATINQNRLTVRAGAGIVADSDPEAEYTETVNKAMAIGRALELVQQQLQ